MIKYSENETPEFIEWINKKKFYKKIFKISVAMALISIFFTWFSLDIYGFRIDMPDYLGVIGVLVFSVLATISLRSYYRLIECEE